MNEMSENLDWQEPDENINNKEISVICVKCGKECFCQKDQYDKLKKKFNVVNTLCHKCYIENGSVADLIFHDFQQVKITDPELFDKIIEDVISSAEKVANG